MRSWRRLALATSLATSLALAACGSDGGPVSSPTPSVSPSPDPCSVEVLLPWFKSFIDGTAPDLEIVDVDVVACRNGYAHVYAVPYNDPQGAPPQYDSEQFWLKLVDGEWTGVASGTGITCEDTDRTPEHAAACDALGES